MSLEQLLDFAVIGSLVAAIGSFAAMVVKDFFFARSFESWKNRQTLDSLFKKYRDPMILSATELAKILAQICNDPNRSYLDSKLLKTRATQTINSADDPVFRKYKLTSTVYRLCAFLGWLELYRQDVVFLDTGQHKLNRRLEESIEKIRDDLADGRINNADDWIEWRDSLIFREEQRAIGETMIPSEGNTRVVLGYSKFSEAFYSDDDNVWISKARDFFLSPPIAAKKDFRVVRMKRLVVHLADLIELLDEARLSTRLRDHRTSFLNSES